MQGDGASNRACVLDMKPMRRAPEVVSQDRACAKTWRCIRTFPDSNAYSFGNRKSMEKRGLGWPLDALYLLLPMGMVYGDGQSPPFSCMGVRHDGVLQWTRPVVLTS